MDEFVDCKLNEECLLLAYYFGRINLLNCVALQRITQDLISAFESPPDKRSTKYTEPIDGCCLCEEKEALFKTLLNQYYENTTNKGSGTEQTKDLERSWQEVSETWNKIQVQAEVLGKDRPKFDVGQACQELIENHGLEVFGEEEYNRDSLDAKWQALTMGIKNKLEACNCTISRINGKAKLPTNPGPNVTNWFMRNVYLTLVTTKKAARTRAKFMQNCRKVGLQLRAARDPVSVVAKFTLCALCTRMGNKYKAVELTTLLNSGISYLETNVTLDDFPDTEPTFGDDKEWKRLLKIIEERSTSDVAKRIEPSVPIVQNNNLPSSVRRSDRVPTAKRKNESFFYYDNGDGSSTDESMKQRRASLPVLPTTPVSSSFVTNLPRTPTSAVAEITSESLTSSDEASAERKPTSVAQSSDPTTTSTSIAPTSGIFELPVPHSLMPLAPSSDIPLQKVTATISCAVSIASSSDSTITSTSLAPSSGIFKLLEDSSSSVMQVPHSLVPLAPSSDIPLQKVTATISLAASIAPSCGDGQKKDATSIAKPLRPRPGVIPAQRRNASVILTNVAQSLQSRENNRRPLEAASTPKVIPITPSSLAQLISNPQSQKVILFQGNNFSKGVDLKKTLLNLKKSTAMAPIAVRSSSQTQKMLFQTIKPRATESTMPKTTRATFQKKPFLVKILNGRIHKPNGTKVTRTPVMKSIPLSKNHLKFVRSVSLKNSIKPLHDPGKSVPVQGVASTSSTDSIPRTLVLGGDMKRGSIMHVGPLSNPPTSIPQFQLGKSFTFQTKSFPVRNNTNLTGTGPVHITTMKSSGNVPKKILYAAVRSKVVPLSAAPAVPKKSNPSHLSSPSKTPAKKKRLPSKSMATVVAEHIFSLMPSSDPNLWKKLNTKNIRRSEKNGSLIPVPYESNFLCIHDTVDNLGWKAYWYRKCRCSRIREKAAESDSEQPDEPCPVDVAAWLPKQVTETMRTTLNQYVESDDHVSGAGLSISNSPPKEKSTPTVRVLLEDCDPKCALERDGKNVEKVDYGEKNTEIESVDESESVNIETVDDQNDVMTSSSNLKQKPCDLTLETAKKTSILTLKAKYRKDKNGNWTSMMCNDQTSDSQKCGNDGENTPRGAFISNGHEDGKKSEDSVMLNIQPELNSANGSSTVAMEDRVGTTTSDHGIRRCPRATMARRKDLVRRAFDAETRFKPGRERAEASASASSQFVSFRDESLTNPTFDVVTSHPMCFREEPEFYINVSTLQKKQLEIAHTLCINDNTRQALYEAGREEDPVMALLSSPVCLPSSQENVKKNTIEDPVVTPLLTSPATPRAKIKKIKSQKVTVNASNNKSSPVCSLSPANVKNIHSKNSIEDPVTPLVTSPETPWAKVKKIKSQKVTASTSNNKSSPVCSLSAANVKKIQSKNSIEDPVTPLVTSPAMPRAKVKKIKSQKSTAIASNSKTMNGDLAKKLECIWGKTKNVSIRRKNALCSNNATLTEPFNKDKTSTENWNFSDCARKVVNQISPDVAITDLHALRGVPLTASFSNIISKKNAQFVTAALQVLDTHHPVVVLTQPIPKGNPTVKKKTRPQSALASKSECLPTWMQKVKTLGDKSKLDEVGELTTESQKSTPICEPENGKLKEITESGIAHENCTDAIPACQNYAATVAEHCEQGAREGVIENQKEVQTLDASKHLVAFSPPSLPKMTFPANNQQHCAISSDKLWIDVADEQTGEVLSAEGRSSAKLWIDVAAEQNGEVLSAEGKSSAKLGIDVAAEQNGEVLSVLSAVSPPPDEEVFDLPNRHDDDIHDSTEMESAEVSRWLNRFIIPNQENSDLPSRQDVCALTMIESGAVSSRRNHFITPNEEISDFPSRQDDDVYASTETESGEVLPSRNLFITRNRENSISKWQKPPENLTENAKNAQLFVTTDTVGIDEVCDENEIAQDRHIPVLTLESETPTEFRKDLVCENDAETVAKLKPRRDKHKNHGILIPTFFAIHRGLRVMSRMSKRGSLAHLSHSRTGKDSVAFKKHLRERLKASRRLATLLSNRYDMKRVLSKVTKKEKGSPKRLGAKGSQNVKKSVKFKSKKSTRRSPLSNMLNWIWDVNDVRNVELAKYMPVPYYAPCAVNTEPKSRESTPERGPFLSNLGDSASKFKDFQPQVHEATTSSDVSEVNFIEPSPSSSSAANSPKQQRKRRREDSPSLNGMYWSYLLDYESVESGCGVNLQTRRNRRIVDEDEKAQANKRKRSGHGVLMSDFHHARHILQADKASLKKYTTQKSNSEWEDEEATALVPLHTLLSRSLNVERVRSWIWDSTSPTPMRLLPPERSSANQKRPKLLKRRYSEIVTPEAILTRDTSQTTNTVQSEADNDNWKRCDPRDDDRAEKSAIKDGGGTERGHAPLMRCSLPQYCPPSPPKISPPPEKNLFLVRRTEKGHKNSDSSRPVGLTKAAKTGVRTGKINFPVLFGKLSKKARKSKNKDGLNKIVSATKDTETEVVLDDDDVPQQSIVLSGTPSGDDVTDGDVSPGCDVRSYLLKLVKIDDRKEASLSHEDE